MLENNPPPSLISRIKEEIKAHKIRFITIVGGVFLFLLLISLFTSSQNSSQSPENLTDQENTEDTDETNTSPQTSLPLFYYTKLKGSTGNIPTIEIYSASENGGDQKLRGQINAQIKQIQPLSPSKFLYVGELGFLDRGDKIFLLDSTKNQSNPAYQASQGYQIESYLLLKDKNTIIVWEESIDSPKTGSSRIISQNIYSESSKKILLQEPLSDETKYPLFYSQATNKIYLDSYSVNRNGKNRGVFSLTLDGVLKPVSNLSLNQYSDSPVLSPNGNFLVYTSYNPATKVKLKAPNVPNQIFREQVRNPNQIKLLDLSKETSTLLTQNLEGTIYDDLSFSRDANTIIFRTLKITQNNATVPEEYMKFSLKNQKESPFAPNPNGTILTQFPDGNFLFAVRSEIIGDLGSFEQYSAQILESMYLYSPQGETYTKILGDDPIQFIGIL